MSVRIVSACSGYGGLELAWQWATGGGEVVAHIENDADMSRVLKTRWPDVPNLSDLLTLDPMTLPAFSLLLGGIPCQPFSAAGRQGAEDDPRYLWPAFAGILRARRPRGFLLENVRNLVSMRKGEVWRTILADARALGYAVHWLTVGACVVGASHHRHRVFALGLYVGEGRAPEARRIETPECGMPDMPALPSPAARDGSTRGEGSPDFWRRRRLWRPHQSIPLGAELNLLEPGSWGRFAPAVARQVAWMGGHPEPTEPRERSNGRRLAAAFPEWMMGLPAGWVSGLLDRNPALRGIGNGVMPQQGAHAIRLLAGSFLPYLLNITGQATP